MHNTVTFESAASACAYKIDRIWYEDNTRNVKEVNGRVPVSKKVTVSNTRKTITKWKKVRWNDAGQCFSRYSSKRYREYDLPLTTIAEQLKNGTHELFRH